MGSTPTGVRLVLQRPGEAKLDGMATSLYTQCGHSVQCTRRDFGIPTVRSMIQHARGVDSRIRLLRLAIRNSILALPVTRTVARTQCQTDSLVCDTSRLSRPGGPVGARAGGVRSVIKSKM